MTLILVAFALVTTAALLVYMLRQKPATTAQSLIHQERYEDAVRESEKILNTLPTYASHLHRAEALKLLGQFEPAAASYRQALALSPGDAAAREGLALALTWLDREPDEARRLMEETIQQAPQIQEFQALSLAWILLRQGRRGAALRVFEDNRILLETRFKDDYTDRDPMLAETLFIFAAMTRAAGDEARADELRAKVQHFAPKSVFAKL